MICSKTCFFINQISGQIQEDIGADGGAASWIPVLGYSAGGHDGLPFRRYMERSLVFGLYGGDGQVYKSTLKAPRSRHTSHGN